MADNKDTRRGFIVTLARLSGGAAVSASMLEHLACAGSGGGGSSSGDGTTPNTYPENPQPGELPTAFTQSSDYNRFFTQLLDDWNPIEQSTSYGPSISDSLFYTMNSADFISKVNDYNGNNAFDQNLRDALDNVWVPVVKLSNQNMSDDDAKAYVTKLIQSLADGILPDLDHNKDQVVCFGYLPNGTGGQKAYMAIIGKDEDTNPFGMLALNGDNYIGGATPITNVDALVQYVHDSPDYYKGGQL